jgi:hypothetical protein
MKNSIVCDISNIACFNKQKAKPKLGYIDLVFSMIPHEFELIAIADRSLYFQINHKKKYKREYLLSKKILEAPAGIAADIFILHYALQHDSLIISNDKFREYTFLNQKWLDNHCIPYMIISNQLYLGKNTMQTYQEQNEFSTQMEQSEFEQQIETI